MQAFNKLYISTESDSTLHCMRPAASGWETFDFIYFNDSTIAIAAYYGKLVHLDIAFANNAKAINNKISNTSVFIIQSHTNNTITLKSLAGAYLAIDSENKMVKGMITSKQNENEFVVERLPVSN